MDDDDVLEMTMKEEEPIKLRRPRKIRIPRREPTLVLPPPAPHYPSPDKTTCATCPCFPKEDPYRKHKKLNPCQHSPPRLYSLAAAALERLPRAAALWWTVHDVARWCEEDLGLPQYTECFVDNHIDGRRLLMLEDPSKAPMINIHDFEHIKMITHRVRALYGLDRIQFSRSVGLPPRRPLVHCTCFHARTGPSWGVRGSWTRADVLRWMKILGPAPRPLDHWELVWYVRPDFPTVKIARAGRSKFTPPPPARLPQFYPSDEYQVPRKFKLLADVPEKDQMIWMQRTPRERGERGKEDRSKEEKQERRDEKETKRKEERKKKKKGSFHFTISEDSHLLKRPVSQEGKRGDQLILARRKMDKPKFLPDC